MFKYLCCVAPRKSNFDRTTIFTEASHTGASPFEPDDGPSDPLPRDDQQRALQSSLILPTKRESPSAASNSSTSSFRFGDYSRSSGSSSASSRRLILTEPLTDLPAASRWKHSPSSLQKQAVIAAHRQVQAARGGGGTAGSAGSGSRLGGTSEGGSGSAPTSRPEQTVERFSQLWTLAVERLDTAWASAPAVQEMLTDNTVFISITGERWMGKLMIAKRLNNAVEIMARQLGVAKEDPESMKRCVTISGPVTRVVKGKTYYVMSYTIKRGLLRFTLKDEMRLDSAGRIRWFKRSTARG